jgi:hypothetical protein
MASVTLRLYDPSTLFDTQALLKSHEDDEQVSME